MNCIDCNVRLIATGDNMNRFGDTDRCIECALRYRYCPQCAEFLLRSDMRNDSCRPCFRKNPTLASYGLRVDPDIKLGEGKRYFGVELETEVTPRSTLKEQLKRIDEMLGENVIMKHDGSLVNGIEIVTRPATIDRQYVLWSKFLGTKHPGLVSWGRESCGMHVHVSRAELSEDTIAKAVCFVNSNNNKKFMYVIAGRRDSGFAKYKQKSLEDAAKYSGDRHENINLSNGATIEFRMFKGTLKKESVYKNIEFCDAILDYCAEPDQSVEDSMSRPGFIKFVRHHETKWPHLLGFIMARWYGKETAMSKQAGWIIKNNCSAKSHTDLDMGDTE